jgi:hypothetical protein
VAGAVAQNSLFDILYEAPDLPRMLSTWHADLAAAGVRGDTQALVAVDLSVTCARIFAQKSAGPLQAAGFDVGYPFLSEALAPLGIAHTALHPDAGAKTWMKEELARHISPELVHRTKSGFIDPARELFDAPAFREALAAALSSDGVARDFLRHAEIHRLLSRRESLSWLPHGHQNLLWVLAFADRWYRTRGDVARDGSAG